MFRRLLVAVLASAALIGVSAPAGAISNAFFTMSNGCSVQGSNIWYPDQNRADAYTFRQKAARVYVAIGYYNPNTAKWAVKSSGYSSASQVYVAVLTNVKPASSTHGCELYSGWNPQTRFLNF